MRATPTKPIMALMLASLLGACAHPGHHERETAGFVPGLGEIMAQTSTRHAKLWFAGQAQNWALAAYEVDELHEGIEDAGKYHPTHKDIRQPIPDLLAQYLDSRWPRWTKPSKPKINRHLSRITISLPLPATPATKPPNSVSTSWRAPASTRSPTRRSEVRPRSFSMGGCRGRA
ncbi:hypothetical protein [Methylomonas koyamae]|uniref:hypothetical protein n=1 Tax=Methylomonas koyamae TaxID=702114 RepID=UPI000A5A7ED8|nr:hypothetical protein [Methylomonas koyamae]